MKLQNNKLLLALSICMIPMMQTSTNLAAGLFYKAPRSSWNPLQNTSQTTRNIVKGCGIGVSVVALGAIGYYAYKHFRKSKIRAQFASMRINDLENMTPKDTLEAGIHYVAAIAPITKNTVTFMHTNADAICDELLLQENSEQAVQPDQTKVATAKKFARDFIQNLKALSVDLINYPAEADPQVAFENPRIQYDLQNLAHCWDTMNKQSNNVRPAANCPITTKMGKAFKQTVDELSSDLLGFAKTNLIPALREFQNMNPLQKAAIQQMVADAFEAIEAKHLSEIDNAVPSSPEALRKSREENRQMINKLRTLLKNKNLYNQLMTSINRSGYATDSERFFDGVISFVTNNLDLISQEVSAAFPEVQGRAF